MLIVQIFLFIRLLPVHGVRVVPPEFGFFVNSLKWPDTNSAAQPSDPGNTLAELATSFSMASGLQLPIWHNHDDTVSGPVPFNFPKLKLYSIITHIIDLFCAKPMPSSIVQCLAKMSEATLSLNQTR